MVNKADYILELLKPILFLLGIVVLNIGVYLYSVPIGLAASGISLIGIALLIEYETRGSV